MDQKMFKLFRDKKTMISTMKDPAMFFRHLKDHDIIKRKFYEKLENNEESVYAVLEFIEKGGPKFVKKFFDCVNQDHILKRYRQLSELNKIIQTFQVLKESSKKLEKGGEVKMMQSSFMTQRDGPSSLSTKRKRETSDVGRAFQSPHLGNNNESVQRPNNVDDGKTGVKKVKTGSSSASVQAGPSFLNPDSQRKTTDQNTEVKMNPWDMPEHKRWLPVTCGSEKGLLDRLLLNERQRDCIKRRGRMISPYMFEEMGMRRSCKNWKTSIKCEGVTLKALMEMGKLKIPDCSGKFTLRK